MSGIGIFGLSGLGTTLIAMALSGIVSAGGGYYVAHEVGEAKFKGMELQYALAQGAAVKQAAAKQHDLDQHAMTAALAESAAQQNIEVQGSTILQEVTRYVKVPTPASPAPACVTVGLVRVLDAAVLGRDPGSLPDLAGKSDDACAGVTAVDLATNIANNYQACRANAEQLNALISLVGKDRTSGAQK